VKIIPWLPFAIYAVFSIFAGWSYLYLPETLNRPLPNSIEDVVKWPITLTSEEKLQIKQSLRKKPEIAK
jgi:hypothetical protein